jgi:hypothetical protein
MGISLEYHGNFMGETLGVCWMNAIFMGMLWLFEYGTSKGILNIWDIHANIMGYKYPLVN